MLASKSNRASVALAQDDPPTDQLSSILIQSDPWLPRLFCLTKLPRSSQTTLVVPRAYSFLYLHYILYMEADPITLMFSKFHALIRERRFAFVVETGFEDSS